MDEPQPAVHATFTTAPRRRRWEPALRLEGRCRCKRWSSVFKPPRRDKATAATMRDLRKGPSWLGTLRGLGLVPGLNRERPRCAMLYRSLCKTFQGPQHRHLLNSALYVHVHPLLLKQTKPRLRVHRRHGQLRIGDGECIAVNASGGSLAFVIRRWGQGGIRR